MKEENEKLNSEQNNTFWVIFLAAAVGFIMGLWYWYSGRLNKLRQRKTLKSELAEKYSVDQRALLRWIEVFCSEDYKRVYAKTHFKKIPQYDIYTTFGRPVRGEVFDKARLASDLSVHRNTLNNRLKGIEDFQKKSGITYEQYKSLRTLPPKFYFRLIKLHDREYPSIPSKPGLNENLPGILKVYSVDQKQTW